MGESVIMAGDFNIPLSTTSITKQKTNKDVEELTTAYTNRIQSIFIEHSTPQSRIHIPFKCRWDVCQDRSRSGP